MKGASLKLSPAGRKRIAHLRNKAIWFLLVMAFTTLVSFQTAAAPAARPNIVFILVDDLRWDEIDYPFVKIPHVQRIAREGVDEIVQRHGSY